MSRIPHWALAERSPTLRYRNTETNAHAVLARTPGSYATKWRAVILADGNPVWTHGFATKDVLTFRAVLREHPAPELRCRECDSTNIVVGENAADGGVVTRWYDCRDYGDEAPSQVVYAAER